MQGHYLPIREGYLYTESANARELIYEGYQSCVNAISLISPSPAVRVEYSGKEVDMAAPFIFLSFAGEGGRIRSEEAFGHKTLYFSVFDFFTEYNRISLEGLKILYPGRYAHERLLDVRDEFHLSLSHILSSAFMLLKSKNPSFRLSEERLIYEFIRLYQKEMAYIGVRVPTSYKKGLLSPAFELLGNKEGRASLEDMAKACSLSKSTFIRKFKDEYGASPSSYMEIERLKAAKYFLEETNDSISDIAYRLGYSSPSSFDRAYKRVYGISPKEERQKV